MRLLPPAHSSAFLAVATLADAAAIAELRNAAGAHLTAAHGEGHWSGAVTERGVRFVMTRAVVYVAFVRGRAAATMALARRKPWAIDTAFYSPAATPVYLSAMAVAPAQQGRGLGRKLLAELPALARDWGADAVRLAAWDAAAGAGGFYSACGFTEVGRAIYRRAPLVYLEWRPR